MKTFFLTSLFGLLLNSFTLNAADVSAKPMLLAYAKPVGSRVPAERVYAPTVLEEENAWPEIYTGAERPIEVSPLSRSSDDIPDKWLTSFSFRGIHLKQTSSASRERQGRSKFCMGNLLEGSLYDFKKKNNLRFEVASPTCQYKENSSLIRYEQFQLTFLLRFRM